MVVVFDSDVLILMVLPASKSTRLFHRLRRAGHTIATSPQILAEVREKLLTDGAVRAWLELPDRDLRAYLRDLPRVLRQTRGLVTVRGAVKDDPDDDQVVAAALESNAAYIVSEDRHLRALRSLRGITILNRDEFAQELDRLGIPDEPPTL